MRFLEAATAHYVADLGPNYKVEREPDEEQLHRSDLQQQHTAPSEWQ